MTNREEADGSSSNQATPERIRECLQMLRAFAARGEMNEMAVRLEFASGLTRMFPEEDLRQLIHDFLGGSGAYLSIADPSSAVLKYGFADTLNGRLLVEYKANLRDRQSMEDALDELRKYTASRWTSDGPESVFCCVATDILRWKVYQPIPNTHLADGTYTKEMVDLGSPIEVIDASIPNEDNAHHITLLLTKLLIDQNLLALTGPSLRQNFGYQSSRYASIVPMLNKIIGDAREDPAVRVALDLWTRYQAYNARNAASAELYIKDLYLVVLSRLIVALRFTDRTAPAASDETLREILSGAFFRNQLRLGNFVERDFFGWATSEPWLGSLMPIARELYHQLRSYDFSSTSRENILRLVYDEMLPTEQQALLGQRSTPERLVTPIIKSLFEGSTPNDRFLDPACGTGTFLYSALRQYRAMIGSEVPPNEKVISLVGAVTGIDVDPVAVILAKAVWVLALGDLLPYSQDLIDIPIFHANSLFVEPDPTDAGHPPSIDFDDVSIKVPEQLFRHTLAFDKLVIWSSNKARVLAQDSRSSGKPLSMLAPDAVQLELVLRDAFSDTLKEHAEWLARVAASLTNELARRMIEGRNGIWAFIVRNSNRPSLLAGQFQLIATNPPWLAMSRLADVPYKGDLEKKASYFHIKPAGSSALHLEIATTFALHCVMHFLVDGGKAAFVMPYGVIRGNHHDPFRRFQFASVVPFVITEIWDLSKVTDLFKIRSCVLFGKKDPSNVNRIEDPIPAAFWGRLDDGSE